MPELPEVETMCRGIRSIEGLRVFEVNSVACRLKPILMAPSFSEISRQLTGKKICRVTRLGKRVVIHFEGDFYLVIEPRMTGLVMLEDPPNQTHLRFELILRGELSGGGNQGRSKLPSSRDIRLLFWDRRGLGTIRLLTADDFERSVKNRLGPDALQMNAEVFRERFRRSKREIKVGLLDQAYVAGIGNIYAAEILFLAGVDPRTRCDRIRMSQWERIADATEEVLSTAIDYEGSTLSDGTYRNAINGEGSYQQYHRVYDREDESCKRCQRGKIKRITQAQRSTFYCPCCQLKKLTHDSLGGD